MTLRFCLCILVPTSGTQDPYFFKVRQGKVRHWQGNEGNGSGKASPRLLAPVLFRMPKGGAFLDPFSGTNSGPPETNVLQELRPPVLCSKSDQYGPVWDQSRTSMDQSGLCLGSVWVLSGPCLGSVWVQSELSLGSAWAQSGLSLGSV